MSDQLALLPGYLTAHLQHLHFVRQVTVDQAEHVDARRRFEDLLLLPGLQVEHRGDQECLMQRVGVL